MTEEKIKEAQDEADLLRQEAKRNLNLAIHTLNPQDYVDAIVDAIIDCTIIEGAILYRRSRLDE